MRAMEERDLKVGTVFSPYEKFNNTYEITHNFGDGNFQLQYGIDKKQMIFKFDKVGQFYVQGRKIVNTPKDVL